MHLQKSSQCTNSSIEYGYDNYNNRISMTHNGQKTTYKYTKANILEESVSDQGKNIYSYDDNGNQLSVSLQKIESFQNKPDTSYSIGVRGTNTGSEDTVNTYDSYNQLIRSSNKKIIAKYEYNELGLRTKKTVNNKVTHYIWDNDQIVLELNGNFNVERKYVRGLNLMYASNDNGGDKAYYIYNGHGDVVQLVSENGSVIKEYEYDSFGNEISPKLNDNNPFLYSGEYYNLSSGTYYLRARNYDTTTGTFTTADDRAYENARNPLSLNKYTYCHNDPVNNIDPTGHTTYKNSSKSKTFSLDSGTLELKVSAKHKKSNIYTIKGTFKWITIPASRGKDGIGLANDNKTTKRQNTWTCTVKRNVYEVNVESGTSKTTLYKKQTLKNKSKSPYKQSMTGVLYNFNNYCYDEKYPNEMTSRKWHIEKGLHGSVEYEIRIPKEKYKMEYGVLFDYAHQTQSMDWNPNVSISYPWGISLSGWPEGKEHITKKDVYTSFLVKP